MKSLQDFAPDAPTTKSRAKAKPEWREPELTDLAHGRWLAFDPSLSSTGWVLIDYWGGRVLKVLSAGTLVGRFPEGATGWAKNFAAAEDLHTQVRNLLRDLADTIDTYVAHEAPPMGGGKFAQPESAIMASLMIRRAVLAEPCGRSLWLRPMVRPQDHKRVTCGNPNAKKIEHHKALRVLMERLAPGSTKIVTNEHGRDAFSVGITDMIRRQTGG